MSARVSDPKREALEAVVRQAEFELARGVRFWSDPALIEELRALVREVVTAGEEPVARARIASPPRIASPTRTASAVRVKPPPSASSPGNTTSPANAASAKRPEFPPAPAAVGRAEDWETQFEALREEASACTRCGLCRSRSTVVFGSGNAKVPLVFVGEAPGADEDRQGLPFVGRSGQLLTKIIEAIGLRREDCYICNVLKCRPPDNRNPLPEEIAHCSPYLEKQIELLKPKVICTLGLFATQRLLDTQAPIGQLRGRWHEYRGVPVLPTYHPAALLRNPALKATVWEDVQLLRRRLDE